MGDWRAYGAAQRPEHRPSASTVGEFAMPVQPIGSIVLGGGREDGIRGRRRPLLKAELRGHWDSVVLSLRRPCRDSRAQCVSEAVQCQDQF